MDWDTDKVTKLDDKQLKILRQNALRKNITAVVEFYDVELNNRATAKVRVRSVRRLSVNTAAPILGFHFVCDNEQGVTRNSDGTFWSGTWVVDKRRAEESLKISAYVALHRNKSEPSYAQGVMRGWRESPRERRYGDQDVKIPSGIDFLIEPTAQSYEWVGDGSGEKGYARETPNADRN